MRIFVIYRHYWPDNPHFAKVLKLVLERAAAEGHQVTVFSAPPSYKAIPGQSAPHSEVVGGVSIYRMRLLPERRHQYLLRAVNTMIFAAGALTYGLFHRKPDVVFVNSAPAFIMGYVARLLKLLRGVPFVYNLQDIHPEASVIAGMIQNPLLIALLKRIELSHCKHAATVMTLSEDMAHVLRGRGYIGGNIKVVNNFLLPAEDSDAPPGMPAQEIQAERFVVLYAGNHGRFQGLDHVLDAARRLRHRKEIQFVFMGDGPVRDSLIEFAGDMVGDTVTFLGHQPWDVALATIQSADLALVPIRAGMIGVSYPSKIVTTVAMGTPILATVDTDCALAGFLRDNGFGEIVRPDDGSAMAQVIEQVAGKGKPSSKDRARIRKLAEDYFGTDKLAAEWVQTLTSTAVA